MYAQRDKCHFDPVEVNPNRDIKITHRWSVKPLPLNGGGQIYSYYIFQHKQQEESAGMRKRIISG